MDKNKKIPGLDFTWNEVNKAIKKDKLLSFDLEFSRACNLKCRYCYAGGKALKDELSLQEIYNVIDQAVDLGAKNVVNIGGGEPLLYKYYWHILNYERKKGLKSITFTNGTLITKKVAKKLADLKEGIVLKYNSSEEKVQDWLTQKKGTGKRIKQALKNLLSVGYSNQKNLFLALETVVTKQNYNEIENLYKKWRTQNIVPYVEILTEQGLAIKNKIRISPEQGKKLFLKLLKYDENEWGISWPLTPPIAGQICKRMLYSAYIRSDGNVQPCPGVEIESFDSNIRNRSLKWILKNVEVFKDVRNIYNNLKGKCSTCHYKNKFGCYGCRGTALFQGGDYLGEDPTCWYINEEVKMGNLLNKFHIKYEIINHVNSGKTTTNAQKALSLPKKNILKSLLFKSKKGNYLGVLVRGDNKVNINYVENYFYQKQGNNKYKKLRMATKEEAFSLLNYEIGGIPPTAFYGVCDVICDNSLLSLDFVVGAGGTPYKGLKLNPLKLKKVYSNWGNLHNKGN